MRWSAPLFVILAIGCRGSPTTSSTAPTNSAPAAPTSAAPASAASAAAPVSAASSVSAPPAMPKELACVARHYEGKPVNDNGAWSFEIADGARSLFDDGKKKSTAQRIEAPDIEDMFALRYPNGAIAPITDEEQDPGRIRVEPLFRATYGVNAAAVSSALVSVKIAGKTVRFHKRAAPALERVATKIDALLREDPSLARFFRELGGTFAARSIAGTDRTSAHAWGIAIDIDTGQSDYWRNAPGAVTSSAKIVWRNRIPQSIVDAFESESFVWGGRWFHYDTMHFEYRPELFGPCLTTN